MKRPPIPRTVLPHRAELHSPSCADVWQHQDSAESYSLKYIRMDEELLRQTDKRDTRHVARWLLFYDCRTSLPRGIIFRPGQVVQWNGLRLTVREVHPVYEDWALHHYEVELEGGEDGGTD